MRRLLAALVPALALSACLLNPVDGQTVTSTTAAVSMYGVTPTASQEVFLEYWSSGTWHPRGSAVTGTTPSYVEGSNNFYAWTLPATLPAAAWSDGTTGKWAKVRFKTANGDFLTSFGTNMSACRAANPKVADFISHCKSPRSPEAYLYTSNFPAGVDLVIETLYWSSSGRTEVVIVNKGRPGIVTRVECSRFNGGSSLTVNQAIATGGMLRVFSAVAPIGRVSCTVFGTNEDGTPEANTSNNTATRYF